MGRHAREEDMAPGIFVIRNQTWPDGPFPPKDFPHFSPYDNVKGQCSSVYFEISVTTARMWNRRLRA